MKINKRSDTLSSPLFSEKKREKIENIPSNDEYTLLYVPDINTVNVKNPQTYRDDQKASLFDAHLTKTSLTSKQKPFFTICHINKRALTNFIGLITTAIAMTSPGLFGLLLTYTILPKECPVEIRLVISIGVGLAAAIGKYRLMRLYSQEACNWIADLTCEKLFQSSNINFTNFINMLFSTVAGGCFAYLAKVGSLECGNLSRNLHNKAGNISANIIESPYIWTTLVSTNIIANVLCFPPMHKMAVGMLTQLARDCLMPFDIYQERKYKQTRLAISLNPLMQTFNSFTKKLQTKNNEEVTVTAYQEMLTELKKIFNESSKEEKSQIDAGIRLSELKNQLYALVHELLKTDDIALAKSIIATAPDLDITQIGISRVKLALEKIIGLGLTAFCIMGLTNFIAVVNDMSSEIGLKKITIVLEAMAMISMSLMAFTSVFFYGKWFIDCLDKHKAIHPEMLTTIRRNINKILNTLICAVGATPNTYQSMVIAKQSLYLIIPAAIGGSFLLEVAGAYQLTCAKDEEAIINKLTEVDSGFPRLLELVKKLDRLIT